MHHCNAFKAFTQSLQLKVATPFPILFHQIYVIFKGPVLLLVKERLKELLVSHHVLAGLLSEKHVRILSAIYLVGEGPKQAVTVPSHIF